MSAQTALKSLVPLVRAYAAQERGRRRSERLWANAATFEELCKLMVRFVNGELNCWPYHLGPFEHETDDPALRRLMVRGLSAANEAGFLTTGGQPGEVYPRAPGGHVEQRATVEGFAHRVTFERLERVVGGEPLVVRSVETERRWGIDYSTVVESWMVENVPEEGFGCTLSRREIRRMWLGIEDYLIKEIIAMRQVLIYDKRYGDHRTLYERLARL